MNLQFEALRAYMKSGANYDDTNIFLKNVVYDVEKERGRLAHSIVKLITRIENISKQLNNVSIPNSRFKKMKKYTGLVHIISNDLFDNFTSDTITTPLQTEWKEYFHSLYDLIVIADVVGYEDTFFSIAIKELYKYWDVLEPPKRLNIGDHHYNLVERILDVFMELRIIHKQMIHDNIDNTIRESHIKRVRLHKESLALKKQLDYEEDILSIYDEMIRWSMK
jgi:hypothetical protein